MNTNLPFKAPGLKSLHDSALSLYTWIAPEKLPIQQLRTKQYSMYIYVHCESALKKSMLGIRQRRIYLISLLNLFHSSGTILFYYAYGIMWEYSFFHLRFYIRYLFVQLWCKQGIQLSRLPINYLNKTHLYIIS